MVIQMCSATKSLYVANMGCDSRFILDALYVTRYNLSSIAKGERLSADTTKSLMLTRRGNKTKRLDTRAVMER